MTNPLTGLEIAVVGLAGRFPGAPGLEAFWQNLCGGVESITFFSEEELRAAGIDAGLYSRPGYVPARGALDGVDLFDAALFDYSPREAELIDPQQRLFLECAWEALESAGYDPWQVSDPIGLYAGCGANTYLVNLLSNPELLATMGTFQVTMANDKDYLATRTSFKLNLRGPSMAVQTACSTSLVAVHVACQSLLAGEARMALAGGVKVVSQERSGYFYREGGIDSPDGHCRTFDVQARGTVSGSGVGVVVLKRLDDALADGDRIWAVIKGSAVNNDGAVKAGYTAPSVDGQAAVVRLALAIGDVSPETVGYVEAHGTATELGDPVEIAALSQVFAEGRPPETPPCAIGSVKSNIGHLDAAAGVAGLIKTVFALDRGLLPPSLHCEVPNPEIDFERTPFRVQRTLSPWTADGPRRAGVSSFGIGGTNAHVVLEQAPPVAASGPGRPWQLLLLSARTLSALERRTDDLAAHLWESPGESLADVAFTCHLGRRRLGHRRIAVCRDAAEAAEILGGRDPERLLTRAQEMTARPVVFLLPGQGAQYAGMGQGLYSDEPVFREALDRCSEVLRPRLGLDLRQALGFGGGPAADLAETWLAQPALFAVGYALATLWREWGVRPAALLGHSVGEYLAACLAEVMTLEDTLALVALRGRLMQEAERGSMLSVTLSEGDLAHELGEGLSVAAVNGPEHTVVSGETAAIEDLRRRLEERGVAARLLRTSHAFHSALMDPIVAPFRAAVAGVRLQPPRLPCLSNLTGDWITAEQATDPGYWADHLRHPVRFGQGLGRLLDNPRRIFLEVGPGRTLTTLAKAHPGWGRSRDAFSSLRHPQEAGDDLAFLLTSAGRLWLAGADLDGAGLYRGQRRRRVPLPTYPFERQRYWIEPGARPDTAMAPAVTGEKAREEALPAPAAAHARPDLETAYIAPRTPVEETVAGIWQSLLGIGQVGVLDNFFELGGHSLLATQVVARLRQAFGLEVSLRTLFEVPTVAGVARAVEERLATAAEGPAEGLPVLVPDLARRSEPFPLTEVQQAYWIGRTDALDLGNVATHAYTEVELTGLDLARFEAALRRVIDRQGMLRAIVQPDGRQCILEQVPPYEIRTLDLAGLPDGDALRALAAVRGEMSHQVLPSDRWPLFEVRASRLDGERIRLHFSFDFLLGDAWSFRVLFAELGRFYLDPGAAVAPLELSFRDYVLAEKDLEKTPVYRRSLEYWRGRLATLPPAPDLPLARHPSQVEQPRFIRRTGSLSPAAWEAVKARAGRAGLTPSGVLLTAFGEVLSRWSKSPRFTLNLTLFNRLPLHPQVNELIGDFTSLTLLEVDAAQCAPFLEHAQSLQRRLWEDLDHRHVGGVRVLRELAQAQGQRRGVAMPVVFTSLLGLSGGGGEGEQEELLGISGEVVYSISQTPQVWIDHQAAEGPSGLSFNWDVVEELFPEGFVDQLFGAYIRLLGQLAEDDEAWHRPVEARDLGAWPVPVAEGRLAVPAGTTLHGLFMERAAQDGDRPALVSAARTMTYAELDRLTDRLAARLRRLGARPDRLVAVVMEKGWEQAAAVLAVLKAGAAYLPIDPVLPRERRFHLLAQGGAGLALIQPWLGDRLEWPGDVALLAVSGDGPEDEPAAPLPPVQNPESLAYVIFTSGSTGLPKGVMIDHRGAVNTVLDINQRFGVGSDDRVLAVSSLSFDLSVYDIFGLLAAGGAVVFPEPSQAPDPARWLELLHGQGVTLWNTVPALLELLVDSLDGRGSGLAASLRLFLLSGDWIPVSLPGRVRELRPDSRIVSLGGATEASIWSILYEIEDVDPAWKSIPYGRALANQSFRVLDSRLEPRPVWVPGELYIGGVGVALGYWRDEVRTQAGFLVDSRTGERLYRTGDLGRLLPDGNIEFLGREDQQVKLLGHRIELGEIEAVLEEHAAVRSGVVATLGEDRAKRRLVAYVVPHEGEVLTEETLARFLGERLPAYMVPARFVFLGSLPLTSNGKVDRRALPLPGESRPEVSEPARTPSEEMVAGIWADALGLARIGIHDDFFASGGDSLQAVRVLARLREAFGVDLSLRQIFEAPTVAELAARVEEARSGGGAVRLPAIVPGPRGGEVPLSFGQERLWILDRLSPGHPAYILPLPVRLLGRLDPAVFEHALTEVVRRHDALRTTFPVRGDGPVQAVAAPEPVHSPRIDLQNLPDPVREAELSRLIASEARRPFDLAAGPLMRALLVQMGEAEHVALFTLHHIVTDGWSMDILVREVAAHYSGRDVGGTALPELPVQYTDYARWQRRHLTDDYLAGQLAYWEERLAGAPPRLELPTDRPRPAAGGAPGAKLAVRLPAELGRAAVALSRARGATPFMTFLSVFQVLLQRYSGQEDVLVGTPVANRGRAEIEGLIGFFVNTLVLRADLSGDPTFAELLARVRTVALEGFARPDLPFERLVQELQPQRDPSTPPLFQVLFALQNAPASRGSLEGLTIVPIEAESAGAQFDLSLSLTEGEGGLRGWIEYRADLFLRPTIVRLLGHFESLLAGALARPEVRIGDLPLLRPAELHQVRCEWGWSEEAGSGSCLHELFAAQAVRRPDAWAVVQGEERLTYGELDRRANRLAHRLRRLGVGPETLVGLCAERSPDLVVGLLGILKAGGGYVPLDPSYPAERLSWILEDSQAGLESPVVVVQRSFLDSLPGSRACVVLLDDPELMEEPAEAPAPGTSPESLAYVIYTSGSTGRPKGVPIQHRNVTRLFASTDAWFGFGPGDIWTLFHSYAFDFSVWEIWGALLYGGRLVIVPYLVSRSPESFCELLLDEGVTVLNQTPSAFRQLIAAEAAVLERRPADRRELALRLVVFGGEALELASLRPWFERHGDEHPRLINMYGITETTVHVTYRPVRMADLEAGLTGRIGGPIPDLRLVLLDRGLNPVPIGVPGEILVGGAGLGSGYLHNPVLTAERFIPDPLAGLRGETGARLYRSGDLARRRPDGDLEYLGRIDHQIKIRGFRVELGEIEAALATHPGVREAAVATDAEETGLRLLAYVASGPGREAPTSAELREHLRRSLPDPMIPSVFIPLELLPLTPNGKVDRRALPRPAAPIPVSSTAARTPAEELIAGVLATVLGLPRMGVEDDFFEVGGHSLLATRAASALKKVFGVDVPLPGFFSAPTARGLADLVAAQRPVSEPPLVPVPRQGMLPLSFAQERLWFVHQLDPGSPAYNIPAAVRILGRLEPPVLEGGLLELVRRHETLRTTFVEEAGAPVQVIAPEAFMVLPVVDLQGLPPEAAGIETHRRAIAEAALPFDLSRGPMLRAILLALGPEEHVLLITLHHIASDGWSMAVLVREAMDRYAALAEGRALSLPPLPIQYADFAVWQRAVLSGEALAAHLAYWRRCLAGAPPSPPIPTDRPRPPVQRFRGAEEIDHLDDPAVAGLRALARQESVTLFMALFAGFCACLHDRTGETDVVVGTDIANRNRAETEPLIGFFVNQLALRVDLSGDPSFRELLARVRRVALEAYQHQDLPFDRVVEALSPRRDPSRSPLFQVKLGLQNLPRVDGEAGLRVLPFRVERVTSKLDLNLSAEESPHGLHLSLQYDTDLFDAGTVRRLLAAFKDILHLAADSPDAPLTELGRRLAALEGERQTAERRRLVEDEARLFQAVRRRPVRPSA